MGVDLTIFVIKDKNDPITFYINERREKSFDYNLTHYDLGKVRRLTSSEFKTIMGIEPWDYIEKLPHHNFGESHDERHSECFYDRPQIIDDALVRIVEREFWGHEEVIKLLKENIGKYVVGYWI
jgi:hypothetical protein